MIFWMLGSALIGVFVGVLIGYRLGLWSMLLLLADQGPEYPTGLEERFEAQADAARKGLN